MRKTITTGVQRSHIPDQVTSAIRKSNELHTRHQKVDPPRTTMWKRRSPRRIKHSKGHSTEGSSQFLHGGWRPRCSPTARGRWVGQKISVGNWTNEGAQIVRAQPLAGNVKGTMTSRRLLSPVLWPISKPRSRAMTMVRCALSSSRSKRLTRQESENTPHIPCAVQERKQWPQEPRKQSQRQGWRSPKLRLNPSSSSSQGWNSSIF